MRDDGMTEYARLHQLQMLDNHPAGHAADRVRAHVLARSGWKCQPMPGAYIISDRQKQERLHVAFDDQGAIVEASGDGQLVIGQGAEERLAATILLIHKLPAARK